MIQPVDERVVQRDPGSMVSQHSRRTEKASAWQSSAVSRFAPLLVALLGILGGLSWSQPAHAYAWMIRHDYSACQTCHTDPSGGQLLTKYGRATADLVLRMHYGENDNDQDPDTGVLWGAVDLPDSLLLSGSFRNLYIIQPAEEKAFTFVPVMQGDLYGQVRLGPMTFGGSIGIAKVPEGSLNARAAQVTTDQGDGMNMIAREYYVGANLGDKFLLRGGRLNLPFGVRVPEHTAWVREATRTDRESDQQVGLALAYTGEDFRGEIMAIAGNYQTKLSPGGDYSDLSPDAVRERGYSLYLEGIGAPRFAAGITSKVTYAKLDRLTLQEDSLRQAHGLTTRWAPFTQLSFLGEADALFRSYASAGYVGFLQADYEPIQGLHLMLTGEVVDTGLDVAQADEPPPVAAPGYGEPRFGGWVSIDWFFWKQFEFRTDLIAREDTPLTILGQFHFYL